MGDVSTVGPLQSATVGPTVTPWAPSSARRCLFGAPNPKKLRIYYEQETQDRAEKDKERWNFDFMAEMPLDCGRYAWTKVHDPADQSGSSTETSSSEDIVLQQTLITDYMRKRKLSTNQTVTSKAKSKAKRRSST